MRIPARTSNPSIHLIAITVPPEQDRALLVNGMIGIVIQSRTFIDLGNAKTRG
jgi:hypothetical protein